MKKRKADKDLKRLLLDRITMLMYFVDMLNYYEIYMMRQIKQMNFCREQILQNKDHQVMRILKVKMNNKYMTIRVYLIVLNIRKRIWMNQKSSHNKEANTQW